MVSTGKVVRSPWANLDVAVRRSLAAVAFGLAVTALILLTPYLTFGLRSRSGHLTLNALDTFIALLVAFLIHGRFLRSGRMQDVLLSQGLALLAISGLGLTYFADLFPDSRPGTLDVWLPLCVRLLGAFSIAGAALVGDRTIGIGRRHRWPLAPVISIVTITSLVLGAARHSLPVALSMSDVPTTAQHPVLTGHPLLLVAQSVAAACFVVGAALFTVQAVRRDDELLRWLGPACVLAAFARLNYLLFPSLYTDWLYTGDILRTGCYLLLLVGAVTEIRQFWNARAQLAVLEDRRRLARELHDGVIQELGYIRGEVQSLVPFLGEHGRILAACDRGLDEARAAVQALGNTEADEPLSKSLSRAVRELAERYAVDVDFDLDDQVLVTPEQRHALVRITREAVGNAAKHAKPTCLTVALRQEASGTVLSIRDDGRGFDVEEAHSRGTTYGLVSMSDRARGLPGTFAVESDPGAGSQVTVRW